jgi:hypothetical protein
MLLPDHEYLEFDIESDDKNDILTHPVLHDICESYVHSLEITDHADISSSSTETIDESKEICIGETVVMLKDLMLAVHQYQSDR